MKKVTILLTCIITTDKDIAIKTDVDKKLFKKGSNSSEKFLYLKWSDNFIFIKPPDYSIR